MNQDSNDGQQHSISERSGAVANALDALISKDHITQEDVRKTLLVMTKNERLSIWILTHERAAELSSDILKQAWKIHGIYAATRILLHGVLKYDSAPDPLKIMLINREKLKLIEKELELAIGYKQPPISPLYPEAGAGGVDHRNW